MDIKDATLMMLSESAGQWPWRRSPSPSTSGWPNGEPVDYRLLNELIGEASGKGVLRALHAKYSPVAHEAIIMPILAEIGRQAPIRSSGYSRPPTRRPTRCARAPGRRARSDGRFLQDGGVAGLVRWPHEEDSRL